MFICKKCLPKYEIKYSEIDLRKSYGSCEVCEKTGVCYDVPHGGYSRKQ